MREQLPVVLQPRLCGTVEDSPKAKAVRRLEALRNIRAALQHCEAALGAAKGASCSDEVQRILANASYALSGAAGRL